MLITSTSQTTRSAADVGSLGLIVGAFMDFLPHAATILSVIWLLIRIYETDTIKTLVDKIFRKT